MNNDEIKVKLSYGVDYYKGDKGDKPIKGVDYFTEQDINEIIERIEAGEIDLTSYATKEYVANAIEGMIVEETDPTVPEWAKAETKPSYTANEVGALPADTQLFSGNYNDLSNKPTLFSGSYNDLTNKPSLFSGNYNDLTNKPTIPSVPVNISAFYNDAGYLTTHQSLSDYATKDYVDEAVEGVVVEETDPTVPSWAKQSTKPSYTASEVGALPANTQLFSGDYDDLSNKPTLFSGNYNDLTNKPTIPTVPSNVSAFTNDAGYVNSSAVNTAIGNATINADQVIIGEQEDEETGEMVNVYLNNNNYATTDDIDALYNYVDGELAEIDPSLGNVDVNADRVLISEEYDAETEETIQTYLPEKLAEIEDAIANIPAGGITVETDPTVPSWAKQANKPTYTAQEVGALPANTALFSGDYNDLSNKPTLTPAPIVIQATIAGQPSVVNGVYRLPLAVTSNNLAEAYAQYQTHPSTVGISVDLSAMGTPTKLYLDCESFYRYDDNHGGYDYETYGEFNDSSLSQEFGYEFMNVTIRLSTIGGYYGQLTGLVTVNQLASKANSADLATVATSGDYNDLTNKPTIPTAYTLPTATTSTLGGVKVDGTTITITDGVISATSSSGSSYTAGQGISIDNGEISVDFGNEIENGGFSFAQHYDNEDYYEYTSNIYPYEINITSYGEADPETGDQETKSISITGEGITFDDTGDTHTLGVSNGELVFDDSPIGSGGGSNTRIIVVSDVGNINTSITADDKAYLLNALDNGYDAYPFVFSENKSGNIHTYIPVKYSISGKQITVFNIDDRHLITLSYFASNNNFGYSHQYLYGTYFRAGLSATDAPSGNAYSTIAQEFTYIKNNYATKAEIVIPSAPSTDGNYVLQATVADGAVVYDWVEVSVGGSY